MEIVYKPSVYLAIDPGHTSGWATFNANGDVIEYGQFTREELNGALQGLIHENLERIIVEDYRNYGFKQQQRWSRNDTSKIIGKIEILGDLANVPVVLQQASVKAIGYKWAGLDKAPSNHSISHQFDAIAHGVYWLQQNGVRQVGKAIIEKEK